MTTRNSGYTKPTHPVVEILWLAWFANTVVAILTNWPGEVAPTAEEQSLVGVVLGSFFVLEFMGWNLSRGKPWGGTFSEVVWFRVQSLVLRWLLGTGLAIAAAALVSPFAGGVLLIWLGAHFAFRTGVEIRDEVMFTSPPRNYTGGGPDRRDEE